MIRHSSILLLFTIFIACSVYSAADELYASYPNLTELHFSVRDDITLTCVGEDENEAMWRVSCMPKGVYSIKQQTPHRKVVEIKNATAYNIGAYICYSSKDGNNYIRIFLSPDASCYASLGYDVRQAPFILPP